MIERYQAVGRGVMSLNRRSRIVGKDNVLDMLVW